MQVLNNSPSAGYISWSTVKISYKGQVYNIANGNTDFTYVYWKYSDPLSFYGSDAFPILGADDLLVFLNKNGIHVKVPNATILDGSLIVPESILTDALAANIITTEKLAVGAVSATTIAADAVGATAIAANAIAANHIQAGVITGTKLVADTITSRELAVGAITANKAIIADGTIGTAQIIDGAITNAKIKDAEITSAKIVSLDATKITAGKIKTERLEVSGLTNIVANPKFVNGSNEQWSFEPTLVKPKAEVTAGAPSDYVGVFRSRDAYSGDWFDVTPGESFYVSAWACNLDSPYEHKIGLSFMLSDGSQSWLTPVSFDASIKSWTFKEGVQKAPSNAVKGRIFVQVNGFNSFGSWYSTLFDIRRQGKISTDVLMAGSVIAEDITFKGKLEGASGTFSGKVQTINGDRQSIMELGYVASNLLNADGSVNKKAQLWNGGLQLEHNGKRVEILTYDGFLTLYNPSGTIDLSGYTKITGNLDVTGAMGVSGDLWYRGRIMHNLTDGYQTRYLWSGVNWDEIGGETGHFRADSDWNGIGGHTWKHVNVYKHDDYWALQEMTEFNGDRSSFRVKQNGSWRAWRTNYAGNWATIRCYQYHATRLKGTFTHGLGSVSSAQTTVIWVSGAQSLDNVKEVYVENSQWNTIDIQISGTNFAAGGWIDVLIFVAP